MKVTPDRSAAFTLIELLTVIAIIGILAAIIIPVVGKVRDSARATRCTAGLREVGVAVALFAADNRSRYPVADTALTVPAGSPGSERKGHWFIQIAPYLGAKFPANADEQAMKTTKIGQPVGCPAAPKFNDSYDVQGIGVSYGWNGVATTLNVPRLAEGIAVSGIRNPSRTIMVGERWGQTAAGGRDTNWECSPPWEQTPVDADRDTSGNVNALRLSHNGRSHYVFFDGHVAAYRPGETYTGSSPATDSVSANFWKGF